MTEVLWACKPAGTTICSYWDEETSGKTTSASGVGKTTEQMQQEATFVLWDFANIWAMLGSNYPSLIWSVEGLTADLDGNGVVNMVDLALFVEHWLDEGCQFPDWCSGCDLNANGNVDFVDYAIFADNIEVIPTPITWVYISDPGVEGHEGFTGEMSKYETTNDQYCQFLNTALASGDITVGVDNIVYGANGSNGGADFVGEVYFNTSNYISHSQITWNGASFSVGNHDSYDMSNHSVVEVNWYGATAFCNYYGYRLPTEWEWQAVADYDGSYTYGCGTTISFAKANYYDSGYANPLNFSSYPYTSPVDHYSSYGYGMNDMAGNVWEWTDSIYSGSSRVLRGGSWFNGDYSCSVSYRHYNDPSGTSYGLGFRVCR